jgi:ribosome-associated toxin RatA of RatAB toxin-antitoxin module
MKIGGSHEAEVDATAERCMEILLDVPAYPQWWPRATEAEVTAPGDQPEVRIVFEAPVVGAIDLLARFEPEPPFGLRIRRTGGRLKKLEGPGWTLTPTPGGGCRARYEIEAEMDTGFPGFMENKAKGPAAELLITAPVEALKRRAEG